MDESLIHQRNKIKSSSWESYNEEYPSQTFNDHQCRWIRAELKKKRAKKTGASRRDNNCLCRIQCVCVCVADVQQVLPVGNRFYANLISVQDKSRARGRRLCCGSTLLSLSLPDIYQEPHDVKAPRGARRVP